LQGSGPPILLTFLQTMELPGKSSWSKQRRCTPLNERYIQGSTELPVSVWDKTSVFFVDNGREVA
jgi:hypothetical protein